MSKVRDISNLSNVIRTDASGNISFVSGSTTLATINTSGQLSGSSPVLSSSYALNATSASYAVSASNATNAITASFANAFTVANTLTAQTLVVQTITSSVDFVTGSTRFGSILANTHVFSGSVTMNPGGLFVSGSGLVGIGTTSPAYTLDVSGSGRFISYLDITGGVGFGPQFNIFSNNQSTNNITLAQGYASGTDNIGYLYNRAAADFAFGTSNIERMRITSTGAIFYLNNGNQTNLLTYSANQDKAITNFYQAQNFPSSNNYTRILDIVSSGDATGGGAIRFLTSAANTAPATSMLITSGGNVGIGTSSPSQKLEVSGTDNNNLIMSTTTTGAGGTIRIQANEAASYLVSNNARPLYIQTNSTTRMAISSAGTISIASGGNIEIDNGYLSTSAGSGTTYCSKLYTSYSYPYIDTYLDSVAGTSYEGRIIFRTNNGGGAFGNRMIIYNSGAVAIQGALSKGSGSFRIKHPLASKKNTHQLVHSFIEGPQADLIYSGGVTLVDGKATINIDEAATMTEGTFEALNRNIRVFTSNETSWDNVRGKVVGNILTIECQNTESTDEISWMVIGERQDEHIMDTEWTDENGKVIVEPLIPEEITTT